MASYLIVHDLLVGFSEAPTGVAYFYLPGTTSPMVVYGDDTGTAVTNPVALDSLGSARVYLSQLARMVVQDAHGATIRDQVINGQQDSTVTTTSAAFTGSTAKAALDTALVAFGGKDFEYVPSGAWVGMTPRNWMNGVLRNVMAYGTVGATQVNDGVTPADSAIAAAIADVQAAGGGTIWFPAGTYLCNAALAVAGSGVTLAGPGSGTATIKNNILNGSLLGTTSAASLAIRGLAFASTAASSGKAITITGCAGVILEDVYTTGFDIGLDLASSCSNVAVRGGQFGGTTSGIRATSYTNVAIIGGTVISGGDGTGVKQDLRLVGGDGLFVSGCRFNTGGVGFSNASHIIATVVGCYFGNVSTAAFAYAASTFPLGFFQEGNGVASSATSTATGAAVTPTLTAGRVVKLTATGGAGTVTVNSPAVLPNALTIDAYYDFVFVNAAGGNVTWTLNAVFVTASAIPVTDAHTIGVRFKWDGAKLREVSRADTVT